MVLVSFGTVVVEVGAEWLGAGGLGSGFGVVPSVVVVGGGFSRGWAWSREVLVVVVVGGLGANDSQCSLQTLRSWASRSSSSNELVGGASAHRLPGRSRWYCARTASLTRRSSPL